MGKRSKMSDIWQGLCRNDPDSWDLDSGDVKRWLRAIRACRESCPFLAECVAARTRMYPATADVQFSRSMPSGVIWAGIAYSDTGHVLSEHLLRRLDPRSGTAASTTPPPRPGPTVRRRRYRRG